MDTYVPIPSAPYEESLHPYEKVLIRESSKTYEAGSSLNQKTMQDIGVTKNVKTKPIDNAETIFEPKKQDGFRNVQMKGH